MSLVPAERPRIHIIEPADVIVAEVPVKAERPRIHVKKEPVIIKEEPADVIVAEASGVGQAVKP